MTEIRVRYAHLFDTTVRTQCLFFAYRHLDMRRRSLRSSFVASLRNRFIDLVARWFVPFDQILKAASTVGQFADCNKSRLSSLFFIGAEPLGVAMARKEIV